MSIGLRPFGMISTTLWQSEKFNSLDRLDAQLAYVWLHTSMKTSAGVLRVGPATLLDEVEFVTDLERANEIFSELEAAGLITRLKPFVVIENFTRFNPIKSYKHAIGAFNEVLALPDCEAKTMLLEMLQKQKGAMDLAHWRNKADEPHEILFKITEYLAENASSLNPIETPSESLGNPSGKKRRKNKKEKGEGISAPNSKIPPSGGEAAKKNGHLPMPRPETIALAKAMG